MTKSSVLPVSRVSAAFLTSLPVISARRGAVIGQGEARPTLPVILALNLASGELQAVNRLPSQTTGSLEVSCQLARLYGKLRAVLGNSGNN